MEEKSLCSIRVETDDLPFELFILWKSYHIDYGYELTAVPFRRDVEGSFQRLRSYSIFRIPRRKYPVGMGCEMADFKIYFAGGAFMVGDDVYVSRRAYCLDLKILSANIRGKLDRSIKKVRASDSGYFNEPTNDIKAVDVEDELFELSLTRLPNMCYGKSNPLVTYVSGRLYVMSCDITFHDVSDLGPPSPDFDPNDLSEYFCSQNYFFEVYEQKPGSSGKWTILYNFAGSDAQMPTCVAFRAVVNNRIILQCDSLVSLETETVQLDFFQGPRDSLDDLAAHFFHEQCLGRCLVADSTLSRFGWSKLLSACMSSD